jgi:AcrR family transcriptional regulator
MSLAPSHRAESGLRRLIERAEDLRAGTRRDGERELPLGPKAVRTRAAIIDAGIEVFCELGYASASVGDVHARAGVSLGTYYQYFRDKSDLVTTIVAEHVLSSASRMFPDFDADRDPDAARNVVRGFVRHYAATADFQRVWEEITHLEPEAADFRHRMVELLESSLAASIEEAQRSGRADVALEPALTARALSAMVDRTCYLTFVVGREGAGSVDEVTDVLTALWTRALGLDAASL